MKIFQVIGLSLFALISLLNAAPIGHETAMSGCMRKQPPREVGEDSEENVGPYDEEYGDGTDVEGDPYGDGDGAPGAEDQYQE